MLVNVIARIEKGDASRSAIKIMADGPDKWRPQTHETADHSIPYATGVVLTPLDEPSASASINALKAAGVESVAVCLLHSYASPAHERALRCIAQLDDHPTEVFAECLDVEAAEAGNEVVQLAQGRGHHLLRVLHVAVLEPDAPIRVTAGGRLSPSKSWL